MCCWAPSLIGADSGLEVILGDGATRLVGSGSGVTWDFTDIELTDIKELRGTVGDDVITGSSGDDLINGGGGNDRWRRAMTRLAMAMIRGGDGDGGGGQ